MARAQLAFSAGSWRDCGGVQRSLSIRQLGDRTLEAQIASSRSSGQPARRSPRSSDPEAAARFAALDNELRDLKQKEGSLRRQIAGYESRVASTPSRQREIEQISRGRDTTRDRYEGLMKQYEDARVAASLEQGNGGEECRILDPAIPPRVPTAPNRLWLILIGCAAALVCAFAAMVIAEKTDRNRRSKPMAAVICASPSRDF
jgi:uncharacterized protein involved in exopolysaccharide biosynthesis